MTDDKIELMKRAIREASLGVYMKDHPKNGLKVCFLCDEEAPIDEPIQHDEECGTPQAEDALAALQETHAVVPREPTEAMLDDGDEAIDRYYHGMKDPPFRGSIKAAYKAMLKAAEAPDG